MYLDKVFEELKAKMVKELEAVTLQDFGKYHEWATPHYRLIEQLAELKNLEFGKEAEPEDSSVVEEDKVKEPLAVLANPEPIVDTYPIGHTFKFLKKAFGGVIDKMNYPIPEELVRAMHLENENKIMITGIKGTFGDGSPIYEFDVVDRTNVPNPSLAEIKQGIVDEIAGRLVVTETTSGSIKVNDEPASLFINDKDANRFRIKKGDIVDGRFYINNIVGSFRATYKYNTDDVEKTTSIEARKLQHRQHNQVDSESGLSMIDRLDKTPFLNKSLLLVGLGSRINDFKQSLDKQEEIDLVHLSGDEHKARIRAQILKADFVFISTFENSHDTSKYVATICNEYDIPFTSTSGDGLFSVLRDAKELIEQQVA